MGRWFVKTGHGCRKLFEPALEEAALWLFYTCVSQTIRDAENMMRSDHKAGGAKYGTATCSPLRRPSLTSHSTSINRKPLSSHHDFDTKITRCSSQPKNTNATGLGLLFDQALLRIWWGLAFIIFSKSSSRLLSRHWQWASVGVLLIEPNGPGPINIWGYFDRKYSSPSSHQKLPTGQYVLHLKSPWQSLLVSAGAWCLESQPIVRMQCSQGRQSKLPRVEAYGIKYSGYLPTFSTKILSKQFWKSVWWIVWEEIAWLFKIGYFRPILWKVNGYL